MTRVAPPNNRKTSTDKLLALGLGGIFIAVIFYMSSANKNVVETDGMQHATKSNVDAEIQLSSVSISIGKVPFYHCAASDSSTQQHLILLHGARFTKEDWKTSGILEKFCNNPKLAVSAMDLPVSANHAKLKNLLDKMVAEKYISKLPIALVTPSASGLTMADWMNTGNVSEIPDYVYRWIPVAAGSVNTVEKEQLQNLANLKDFSVFAIYGDKDKGGQKVTQYLQTHTGAKTLELTGGHPVYLDSPDLFVQNVLEDLGLTD